MKTDKKVFANGWIYGRQNACEYMGGLSTRTLSRWVAMGLVPYKRLSSKCLMFRATDLDNAIERMHEIHTTGGEV